MKTGKGCLFYLSQHRKLKDDIICITQSIGNVDKQFRSVAEDFSVMRNEYTAKLRPFRGRGRFTRKTYEQYTGDTSRQVPFEISHFRLDAAGIASCYNTSAGVGILNDSNPCKGYSDHVDLACLACGGLNDHRDTLVNQGCADQISGTIDAPSLPSSEVVTPSIETENVILGEPQSLPPEQMPWLWTGYYKIAGVHYITIGRDGDGITISSRNRLLAAIKPDHVVYKGEKIYSRIPMFFE